MKQQIGFLDLTPTWQGILPVITLALTEGTPAGQKAAGEELARMADAADRWNAHAKAQREQAEKQAKRHPVRLPAINQGMTPGGDPEAFREKVRRAVLDALDSCAVDGKGWTDRDLPALFKVIDPLADKLELGGAK